MGKQEKYCSAKCRAKWHKTEKIRLEEIYSISGAAKVLGISRYAVAYAIKRGIINTILVPTSGKPRRELRLAEVEKLARIRKEKNER